MKFNAGSPWGFLDISSEPVCLLFGLVETFFSDPYFFSLSCSTATCLVKIRDFWLFLSLYPYLVGQSGLHIHIYIYITYLSLLVGSVYSG